jgi:DtxR family Mn-dependent transcriptional regulator
VAHDLIDSTEMYLRTVLELEEEGIPAIRARLTERLGLSAPSVSEGVGRLEAEGLVELAEDRTVQLTATGRRVATDVLRKHRLAERLLVDVLGIDHQHVHEEACRWEHVISDRVAERLEEFLGNPSTSPYGNPIPGAGGDRGVETLVPLADVDPGRVRVVRISEQLQGDTVVMHALDVARVRPGSEVDVALTGAGVELRHRGGTVTVDGDAARLLYVVPLPGA